MFQLTSWGRLFPLNFVSCIDVHVVAEAYICSVVQYHSHNFYAIKVILFSLKRKKMAEMRLLAIWIDQRKSFKIAKKIL